MNDIKTFKQLPTFDVICKRLAEAEQCIGAQGEMILELMNMLREREYEIAFLMNIVQVVIPTSKIAGADGKLPAIRKVAAELYKADGRAKIMAAFEAQEKALRDAQNLSSATSPSKESAAPTANGEDGPVEFSIPGKVTH